MSPIEFIGATVVLLAAASVGVVAHEFAHALTLRAFGVPYRLEWLPDEAGGPVRAAAAGAFARVTPVDLSSDVPAWHLRVAAMAPLVLAVPFVLVAAGLIPDAFATGNRLVGMAAVGLLACALPSPADFSLLWHAERAIRTESPAGGADPDHAG